MQRVRAIPGVTAATPMLLPAFTGPSIWRVSFEAEGHLAPDSAAAPSWPVEMGGPEYFRTLGIPDHSRPAFSRNGPKGCTARRYREPVCCESILAGR